MKRHPPFALKSILLVCFAGFLLAGCRTTPKENSEDFAQIGEDEVLEERITLNILSALDSGDIDKTRKYAELPMLIDASTLPYYATNGSLRFGTAIPFSNAANVYTNRKHRGFSILKV